MAKKHIIKVIDYPDGYRRADCNCGFATGAPLDKRDWVDEKAAEHLDQLNASSKNNLN